jgi:hypothetical protein
VTETSPKRARIAMCASQIRSLFFVMGLCFHVRSGPEAGADETREDVMIWFSHSKYTAEYVSGQFAQICDTMRRETRRMVYVAVAAVGLMVVAQATCLYGLLGA